MTAADIDYSQFQAVDEVPFDGSDSGEYAEPITMGVPQDPEYTPDNADPAFIKETKRSRTAVEYDNKTRDFLNTIMRVAVQHESTVPDAAAIIMHGPDLSRASGNLADADPRYRRMIDWVTDGTENPYAAMIVAAAPLVFQVLRNHEPVLEPAQRGIKIGRKGKRLSFRFGIKLGRLRNMTNDPDALSEHVFVTGGIGQQLEKEGIAVKYASRRQRRRAASAE